MIVTLSMNPAIDRTISVSKFEYGGMNRVLETADAACGKAVNLALAARAIGAAAMCIGLLPEEDGALAQRRLELAGVRCAFVAVPGRLRVNIKLFDAEKSVITEINERGSPVSKEALDTLTELIMANLGPDDFLVLTGSLPPGVGAEYYAQLIEKTRCRCVLDAEGEPLRLGIEKGPALIKPNIAELEMLVGRRLDGVDEVIGAAQAVRDAGARIVVVSLGEKGAALVSDGETLFAPALKLSVKSTVGAGDSMVAGLLSAMDGGEPLETALRWGAAAAAARIVTDAGQMIDGESYRQWLEKIQIQRL